MKIKKVILFIFAIFLLGSFCVNAATVTTDDNGKVVILADVNVYEAKITSQESNQINLSFNLANGQGVQSGVKYSVSLIKETADSKVIVDEYIYPESLSLSSNSTLAKAVSYMAPANINGDYSILVKAKNESGMPLGMALAGKVKLTSTIKTVEIIPESCSLSVTGEKGDIKYNLSQGVDIADTESLSLTCSAVNSSKEILSVTPSYETYYRTVFGEKVLQEGGDVAPISFKAGEKKSITLILPKATKPQSYDIKIGLKTGDVYSNSVTAHYVLRGLSATIQNFSLDKDYYSNNDVANISFVWSPSADSFPDSRLFSSERPAITLTASITDDKSKECITPIDQLISDSTRGGKIDLSAPIKANCNNPQATVTLKDASGNILDQKFLSFETKTDKIDKVGSFGSTKTILIVFGSLVVIGFAVYFINLKRKENETNNQ